MALSTVPQIRSCTNLGRMYSLLVSILLQTFRSRVLLPTIGTQVSVTAFRSSPVADSAVPLAAGFVRPTIRLGDLFLFNGVSAVTCSIILQCHEHLLFSHIPPFRYMTIHALITWSISPCHPSILLIFPTVPPYLCLSHSNLISLLSRIISLIVLCFYLSLYPHSLLSIWLSLYLLHSDLLFYIPLSSYWTFYSTYLLALFLIVIPTKFRVFLTFLLVDSST